MTRYRNKGYRPPTSARPRLAPGMEHDGSHLHSAVVQESGRRYHYNRSLTQATSDRYATRNIVGHFTCYNCPLTNTWHSGIICTQLFMASNGRYRTILHGQQCRGCESYVEPMVDEENYAKKIVSALDLWTGQRERQVSVSDFKKTGPHDEERCHGCQIGICSR
ncbi:MAG: zinc-binding domain-containing protein [Linnemannia elongata]|nr:MAG: zinc-binding domain-containing protein [Linnemannia elongata]